MVLASGAFASSAGLSAFAFAERNQGAKRVGLMANLPLKPVQKFRERLQELGWVEGKNITIEYRYGEGRDDRDDAGRTQAVDLRGLEAARHGHAGDTLSRLRVRARSGATRVRVRPT